MSWSGVQRKSLRVLRSSRSGVRAGASSLVHVVSWLVRPIKEQRSLGVGKLVIASMMSLHYGVSFRG